jgi:hypothetical protein
LAAESLVSEILGFGKLAFQKPRLRETGFSTDKGDDCSRQAAMTIAAATAEKMRPRIFSAVRF